MISLRGSWHIPVIAFVLGGVLAIQEGFAFYIVGFVFLAWLYSYREHLLFLFILLLFGAGGYIHLPLDSSSFSPPPLNNDFLKGKIVSDLTESDQSFSVILKDDAGKVLVRYLKEKGNDSVQESLKHGAVCRIKGEKKPLEGARNPGQFNYQAYMAGKGIHSQIIIKNEAAIQCDGKSWLSSLYDTRKQLKMTVREKVTPTTYIWIEALIFGDTSFIDSSTVEWFREFNLSHILAISGLHVGLTLGGVYFLLYRTGLATRKQSKVFLLLLLPFYMFISGGAPSVLRAGFMGVLLLLTTSLQKKIPIIDLLSFTCLFLLISSPSYFYHLGFQFSFLVTFSLLLTIPILKQYESKWKQSAIIGLVSQLSLLALQVHYFYEFQPFSLWVNMIAVPYFSFFVIPFLMMIFLLSFLVPTVCLFLSSVFSNVHEFLISMLITQSESLDYIWVIGELPSFFIILYAVFFVIMMKKWEQKEKVKAFLASLAVVFVLIFYSSMPYFSEEGVITMLDVGQGDAFVIELPHRKGVIMIDAAGPSIFTSNKEKTANDVILPFFKSRGINRIHALFITHEDSDHSGSVPFILEEMRIDRIYVSPFHTETYENGVIVEKVSAGQSVQVGGHDFDVIHPLINGNLGDPNDNSLVLNSIFGGQRWFFTGDISAQVEREIVMRKSIRQTDVLKVAHHGSHTSTSEELLKGLQPKIGLISAGVDNRYGHPHSEVVERLTEHGVLLLQTNRHGAVQYFFSGQSGTFSTFIPYNASRE
ncbi:DNA internalization-related competence protein ComEC/Rec2 [Halobacillus sp. HZG1]|uniref:DNA internalization-related competence protein ComEC/Rec2 n=1 Tax=Halobacillus sp. HZG1 TaxID=3111769 RepID=UPI002DBC61CD|nr:DNA internalization-related competence protein ComEC/Rec2 [Halobacillus sp. HZG1]MEC3883173.1 DNA internalization-related competence protein ComEC/Rec2 [Halobacillus sp. HZG1]